MVFSSVSFLFFFLPLFMVAYATLPFRNATLLTFSTLFYIWGEGVFVLVLLLSVVINYLAGIGLMHTDNQRRKMVLTVAIVANLTLLAYFKYLGFLLVDVLGLHNLDPRTVPHLPLGISFFTFQSISYLVDVYLGAARPARSIWELAVYIMMFPQLIAGPIVRYATVARQIRRRVVHLNYVVHGMLFFSIGMAQKVLIANNVAGVADAIFSLPNEHITTTLAWGGALAYTLQIYFDFAGYSNMAIGLGLLMGFRFPQNFNYPYISQSITEFWRRWHMSLSSWFRDYVYIPLGGNRRGTFTTYRNLFIVFFLCGLWHGASWTFVVWGLYHGLLMVLERIGFGRALMALPQALRHAYALLAVIIGWVLFRSESFVQAATFLSRMLALGDSPDQGPALAEFISHQQLFFACVGVVAATPLLRRMASLMLTDRSTNLGRRRPRTSRLRRLVDLGGASLLLAVCSVYVASGTYNPFIYFRF